MREFLLPSSKERVTQAIKAVELQTSAELVVALRRSTVTSRDGAWVLGFLAALASLCALLFLPDEFDLWVFPIDVAIAFALGTAIGWGVPSVRMAFVPRAKWKAAVHAAACATFVDLGVHRTRGRTGILVFVSAAEREVEVVRDVGVSPESIGPGWESWVAALQSAVRQGDFAAFVAALESAGPLLRRPLPRAADDINELEDAAA